MVRYFNGLNMGEGVAGPNTIGASTTQIYSCMGIAIVNRANMFGSMATRYFPAILERAPDGFSVFCPDLDGCISHGDTTEDAARQAEQALALHLRGMIEDGDAIPEPTRPWSASSVTPKWRSLPGSSCVPSCPAARCG